MGDVFLKSWMTVYDFENNGRVGLAASWPPSNLTSAADIIKYKLEEEAVMWYNSGGNKLDQARCMLLHVFVVMGVLLL